MAAGSDVVVSAALSQLGKPYAWDTPASADDPNPVSFDCSGLTMWCYEKAGIKLAHYSGAQFVQLKHRRLSEAEPGDLIFFGTLGSIYHVGLYIGDSTIVEAPDYGIPVRRRRISPQSTDIMHKVGRYPGSVETTGFRSVSVRNRPKPVTYRQFFTDLLTRMGLPTTNENLNALATVVVIEGKNDRYNPLNSTVPYGQSTAFNSVGVQDYGTYQTGIAGTELLLEGSRWDQVRQALAAGNSRGAVVTAFSNTYATWGSHPNWGSVSSSEASSVLDQRLGVATETGSKIPNWPYDPDKLDGMKPLSHTVRMRIFSWMDTESGRAPGTTYAQLHTQSDDDIINLYKAAIEDSQGKGGGGIIGGILRVGTGSIKAANNVLGWTEALSRILAWLLNSHNWVRIGLFALGAIILIFAAWKSFGPSSDTAMTAAALL